MSAPPLTPLFLLHPLLGYGISLGTWHPLGTWHLFGNMASLGDKASHWEHGILLGRGIPLGIWHPFGNMGSFWDMASLWEYNIPLGTRHPFGTHHPLGTPHHGTGCHVERSRVSPTPPPPPGHPTQEQQSPGAPGTLLPAGASGQAGCAGGSPSTIWFPTNKRPALAPGRGLAAAAAAAAVYSVPRLWHGPAESPSAFPPAARPCKAPAPRPCPCPTSAPPRAPLLSRGCPSPECPRGFSHPVCVLGWDAQYGGRVGSPTRFLLSGCWLGGVVPPIPSLHPKKLPMHPWGRPGGCPQSGGDEALGPHPGLGLPQPPVPRSHRAGWGLRGAICL